MSRTMKPDEAIMALAFLSNPEALTKAPDSSIPEVIRDDSFGGDFRGRLTKALTKFISEELLDLYSTGEKGSNCTLSTTTMNSETANSSEHQMGVCFGIVEVRKYPITIGANPSVSRGVPRTIEWDHLEEETERHHIDAYERERPNEDRKRGEELLLNGVTRERMLTRLGYTKRQLFEGIRRAKEHVSGSSSRGGYRRRGNDPVSWRMQSKR